jgi:S-adenosylmethionine:tRNA ribosyltransferase-isomerase
MIALSNRPVSLLDSALHDGLAFRLPAELEAAEPPEARGLTRDQVRLLVSHYRDDTLLHTRFSALPDVLTSDDVLVINTSGTLNAALNVTRADGSPLELHLSTQLPAGLWIVEARQIGPQGTQPFFTLQPDERLQLPGGGSAHIHRPYHADAEAARLWIATLHLPCATFAYLDAYGFPIRYSYVKQPWPLDYYQTVYANEPGSAEMPSAGRAFTPTLLTTLIAKGVQVLPLILHTGVASLESHEPPYEEYFRVPASTARAVNAARAAGARVIAVGTTVVRALETVSDAQGVVHPGEGWTSVVITPQRGVRVANGLLTGLHEPGATHLAMLEAIAGRAHIERCYAEALRERYLWHEFGDLHLLIP